VAGTAGDAIALVPNVWRLTCADIPEEAKNAISHRGRALRAMADFLRSRQTAPKRA
jgi:inosine/xanthosine triphosphate pyrophosphatase family protein